MSITTRSPVLERAGAGVVMGQRRVRPRGDDGVEGGLVRTTVAHRRLEGDGDLGFGGAPDQHGERLGQRLVGDRCRRLDASDLDGILHRAERLDHAAGRHHRGRGEPVLFDRAGERPHQVIGLDAEAGTAGHRGVRAEDAGGCGRDDHLGIDACGGELVMGLLAGSGRR
jgi:hypothetical protein